MESPTDSTGDRLLQSEATTEQASLISRSTEQKKLLVQREELTETEVARRVAAILSAHPEKHQAYGLWAGSGIDGVEYQNEMRGK